MARASALAPQAIYGCGVVLTRDMIEQLTTTTLAYKIHFLMVIVYEDLPSGSRAVGSLGDTENIETKVHVQAIHYLIN